MRVRVLGLMLLLVLRLAFYAGNGSEPKKAEGGSFALFREKLVRVYRQQLPEPEAGLVAGVVLGFKSSLDKGFQQELIKTGTVHVVVASGYNVVIVGSVVFNILIYFMKRFRATMGAILFMAFYAVLAGGEPPVTRAVIMGGLVFIAKAVGRPSATGWLLFLAAFLMLMVQPSLLTSVSFQLSVAATVGLVYVEPLIREFFEGMVLKYRPMKAVLETELVPTLAAQVTTTPIIFWYFGRISLISPLVNVLVLPLVPLMMGLGAVQLLLSIVFRPLGYLVAPLTYSVSHLFVVLIGFFS